MADADDMAAPDEDLVLDVGAAVVDADAGAAAAPDEVLGPGAVVAGAGLDLGEDLVPGVAPVEDEENHWGSY